MSLHQIKDGRVQLTQYSTAVPAVPLVPPAQFNTCEYRVQGHLGHPKTWYHSQADSKELLRLNMLVGIIAHAMTLDGEMDDAQKPSAMEDVADHQATPG